MLSMFDPALIYIYIFIYINTLLGCLFVTYKRENGRIDRAQRIWVFASYSNFLNLITLQNNGANLWCFTLKLFYLLEVIVWNIYGLRHLVEKILVLEKFVAKTQWSFVVGPHIPREGLWMVKVKINLRKQIRFFKIHEKVNIKD